MSRFLHSFADKASTAINQSGLAQKLPSSVTNAINQAAHPQAGNQAGQPGQPGQPGAAPPPAAPGAEGYAAPAAQPQIQHQSTQESISTGGGGRSFGFENLQHQFRALQVQYSSQVTEEVKQLQVMITSSKGVTLAHNNVARDTQAYSKELYSWGQKEKDDIKDVSDRLAWINYTHGALEANLGTAIDAARAPLKSVRDAETTLHPRRAARKTLDSQIKQIKLESKSPQAAERIAELQLRLQKLEQEDAQAELDLEVSKRRALQESEQKKWIAIREHAEKLLLLCQASDRVLDQLPPSPPTPQQPYQGAQSTAHTRATLQHALDNFKPGNILLDAPASSLKHHDTLLFGETHAHELSKITSPPAHPPTPQPQSHPQTPVPAGAPAPTGHPAGYHPTGPTPVPIPAGGYVSPTGPTPVPNPTGGYVSPTGPAPLNPGALNNTPAPIPGVLNNTSTPAQGVPISPQPAVTSPPAAVPRTEPVAAVSPVPDAPTVAETGVPLSAASHGGTGPASGSLAGGRVTGDAAPPPVAAPAKYETAEEEKKRLEREERERILRGSRHGRDPPRHDDAGDAFPDASRSNTKDEEEGGPPPYKPY